MEVVQLRLGAGATFHGEGLLAITQALLQAGVSYVGGDPGAPVSHLLNVVVQVHELRQCRRKTGHIFKLAKNQHVQTGARTLFIFTMNQAKYDSLPADLKTVIDDNSGLATSAWAGETAFDAVVAPHQKIARDAGEKIHCLPEAEYHRWGKAAEQIDDDWAETATAKGANGKQLLEEARALVKQYSK